MLKKVKSAIYRGFVATRKRLYKDPERVLNDGERFDPFLTKFYYQDVSHVPRYHFASGQIHVGDSVVDIACGTGWGTEILARFANSATGVDISESAINYAVRKRRGNNINFVRSDFFDYDSLADVVVSFETIEHLRDVEFDDILTKLNSLSRKKIVGSVPYKEEPGTNPHHVIFNLDESHFVSLEKAGRVTFYYQDVAGKIFAEKPCENIQNLLFTLEKNS